MVNLSWPFLSSRQGGAKQRLIFALDVGSLEEVKKYVTLLANEVGLFKVGKQLFLHGGPQMVRLIREKGGKVFLDLKFHDIPRTVARASIEATRLGVQMFNLHASGSLEMMRLTVREVNKVCRAEDLKRTGVITGVENQVVRLAKLAKEAGMDGVVASPLEVSRIRRECGRNFLLVVPGVRSRGESWDDQKRVLTPEEAMRAGADYLVVGKPIRDAKDPREIARQIVREMEQGLSSPSGRTVRLFRSNAVR